jgi:hypothetical protein
MYQALNHYSHPAECQLCHGTFIEWLHKQEPDGYTFGFRFCSNLKTAGGTLPVTTAPLDPTADCPHRHMLPGMNNKVLSQGGAPCELRAAHKGDCIITIEQSTATVRMAINEDGDKPPRILSEIRKSH